MEGVTTKLTIFWWIGDDIQIYLMSDCSRQQIVVLTTVWWWQKLGVEKSRIEFIWRGSISRN
jgi:hypothetical protein